MYNQDFKILTRANTPPLLRQPILLQLLYSLVLSLEYLYDVFLIWRLEILDIIKYNSQVIMLEFLLRKKFNNNNIYIQDDTTNTEVYIYNLNEDNREQLYLVQSGQYPVNGHQIYIYNNEELFNYDFIVYVPIALQNEKKFIEQTINYYKLAGIKYKILWIN